MDHLSVVSTSVNESLLNSRLSMVRGGFFRFDEVVVP